MDISLVDIAKAAATTTISADPMKKKSVIIDFMVMENGEIGVFGIELRGRFSVNQEPNVKEKGRI